MKKILIGLLAVVVLFIGAGFKFYNGTLTMNEQIDGLSKQVDNMYDRRSSLVPQLAAVVKRYAEYESGTLTSIVKLREPLNQLQGMISKGDVKSPEFTNVLAGAMSQIKLSVEQYPVLKADTQFTALFTELEGSENRIRVAIKDFNDALTAYNVRVRSLPRGRLFGTLFGMNPKDRIAPTGTDFKKVPDVDALLK